MSTSIEWTDETWNPLRGCRRISPGCEHCYAERQAARPILSGPGLPYAGLVQFGRQGPRWTGATAGPDQLDVPLRWKKPRKVFPCSMSDLFFEGFSFERIAAVFGIMAATPQHTYQVLTKRIERARRFVEWAERAGDHVAGPVDLFTIMARNHGSELSDPQPTRWPLPNVWIGTSVEDQQRADERLPHLLQIPAAVRFVSYEPALGPVDFRPWLRPVACSQCGSPTRAECAKQHPGTLRTVRVGDIPDTGIVWIIVGGESGPGARPFDLAWARATVAQCKAAGVPVFFKQAGARPERFVAPAAHPLELQQDAVARGVALGPHAFKQGSDWRSPPSLDMLDAVRVDLNALPPAQRPKGPAAKLIASAIEKARSACGSAPPPSCDPGPAEETAPAA